MAIDVGELRAVLTLQDSFSKPINDAAKGLGVFSDSFKAVSGAVGLAVGAIGAAAGAIVALGKRGAEVADVSDAFAGLSTAAGSSAAVMLGELNQGTLNTISNFDLMSKANGVLSSGLITNAKDMGVLASGAKLLADRTGGDTAEAFDKLTGALASGRTASLKQLGLFVDSKIAAEQYAKSIGKTSSDLTEHEKATALSHAAMSALRQQLEAAGPAAEDFSDFISQGKKAVGDFVDNLGVAVAQSPVVMAGMKGIRDAIAGAFGGSQQDMVKAVMGYVNSFAIFLVQAASVAVEGARLIVGGWSVLKAVFSGAMETAARGAALFVDVLDAILKGMQPVQDMARAMGFAVDGVDRAFDAAKDTVGEAKVAIDAIRQSFADQTDEALINADKQNAAFDSTQAALGKIEQAMIAANGTQAVAAKTSEAAAAGVKKIGEAAGLSEQQMKLLSETMADYNESTRSFAEDAQATFEAMQEELTLANKNGLDKRLAEIELARQKELEGLFFISVKYPEMYEQMATMVGEKYQRMTDAAKGHFETSAAFAEAFGFKTRAELEQVAETARLGYEKMLASGEFTFGELKKAHKAWKDAEDDLNDKSALGTMEKFQLIAASASTILRSMFGKSKAAAIAAALIDTAAAIAKALGAYPWPFNLIPAAAAGAAGYAQVNAIRNTNPDGFAHGTPGTLFQDFGRESMALLHNQEAIVSVAQGQTLAAMIGAEIEHARGGNSEGALLDELSGLRRDMRDLPYHLATAVRDAQQTRPRAA